MNKITLDSPYVPWDYRNFTVIRVGDYVVQRRQMPDTPRTVYCIMHGKHVAGRQLSYPTPSDCHSHVIRFKNNGNRNRAPKIITPSGGTLAERVVIMLKMQRMDESELISTMKSSSAALSPILNRLVRGMRIRRFGKVGSYVYSAS